MDIAKLHAEGRQFTTKSGQPVRIICTDVAHNNYPIVALITEGAGEGLVSYTPRGKYSTHGDHDADLVLVPVEQVRYGLMHKDSQSISNDFFYLDESEAENIRREKAFPHSWRIATITWEE